MQAKYLLLFRGVLLETLLLQSLYAPGGAPPSRTVWGLFAAYAALSCGLFWLGRSRRLPDAAVAGSFLLDIAFTTVELFLTAGFRDDFFVAYFLVILSTCFLDRLALSFVIGAVSCVVYGYFAFPGWEHFHPFYLLRMSLLLVTALLSGYVVDAARRIQRETANRYEETLAWMERLSAVGKAMAAVLHEAKTPLATILLTVDAVREKAQRGESLEAALSSIEDEAERTAAILSGFLDFSKPGPLELSRLDLGRPLRQAVDAVLLHIRDRDIRLKTAWPPDLFVLGSERHLIQAFTNVMLNAAQAMPLGGALNVSARALDGRVEVRFDDTGIGLSREAQERLFEPFYTGKPGAGHGLGLTVVRWIAERHQARLDITSSGQGQGAEVTFSFPAAGLPAPAPPLGVNN
ncbi:MAG: HAMP domain-containing histidine kinase [Elusimicrobia bacterium]|nr:HAMP domain-containing histidine kinase [Elusimicrobiota bacterium]